MARFLNLQDHRGMTALHYAIENRYPDEVVQCLVNNGACLFLKNHKGEVPFSLSFNLAMKGYLDTRMDHQIELYGSGKLDYFVSIPEALSHDVKRKRIKPLRSQSRLLSEETFLERTEDVGTTMLEDSAIVIEERKVPLWLPDNKKAFACLNNVNLEKFEYGEMMDNSLTLQIRNGRMDLFKYLLTRHVDPMASNEDLITAFHATVIYQRPDFASYLFTGDETAFEQSEAAEAVKWGRLESWQKKAYFSIDKTTRKHGFTPLHIAASLGDLAQINFWVRMI